MLAPLLAPFPPSLQVFDASPQGFQVAVVDLQARHGKVGWWGGVGGGSSPAVGKPRCSTLPGSRAMGLPFDRASCCAPCCATTHPVQAAQRRYVLLVLWMARQGAGVVPGKAIVDAARRLRVS